MNTIINSQKIISEGFGEGYGGGTDKLHHTDTVVYQKIPTDIWYVIMEFLGFAGALKRKRCMFLTKKGTVCKSNRIKCDCGSEIWCKRHASDIMNETDNTIIEKLREMIGKTRLNNQSKIKYTDEIGWDICDKHDRTLTIREQSWDNYPIQLAAANGSENLARELLEAGANPRKICKQPFTYAHGFTPFHQAVIEGHVNIVKMFSAHGVNVNIRTKKGRTPLMIAVRNNNVDMIKCLIEEGADLDLKTEDGYGFTACLLAIFEQEWDEDECLNLLKILIEAGADYSIRTYEFLLSPYNTSIIGGPWSNLQKSWRRQSYGLKDLAKHLQCDDMVNYLERIEEHGNTTDRWEHMTRLILT